MSDFLSDQPADGRASHLSSNNPFRARAVSPSIPSPTSPFLDPAPATSSGRPVSRNPFLDPASDKATTTPSGDLLISIDDMASRPAASWSSLDDIFTSLKVDDKAMSAISSPNPAGVASSGEPPKKPAEGRPPRPQYGPMPGRPGRGRGGPPPPRAKNVQPRPSSPSNHRPSHSQDEVAKTKQRPGAVADGEPSAAGSSADAPSRTSRSSRPRRNSESSIAPNDQSVSRSERVLRDLRKREQDQRERGSARATSRRNDIIDQMDASSIFGNVFHHDGPFDALNPHRNRKGSRRAPMQAFPKDSLNNVIGGSGPLNARPDHRAFLGQGGEEAFTEFSGNHPVPPPVDKFGSSSIVGVFDPLQRGSTLHGDQTLGLGTSTFLEGTPAARTTIQRREAERAQDVQDNPLQRKKSLAQRFRSINRGPREPHPSRAFSTDGGPASSNSAARYNPEVSPFDEFDPKKGDDIITVRRKNSAALPTPASPPRGLGLERRSTTDGTSSTATPAADATNSTTTVISSGAGDDAQPKPTNGLLARVKSLKGGRRPAPPPPTIKDT